MVEIRTEHKRLVLEDGCGYHIAHEPCSSLRPTFPLPYRSLALPKTFHQVKLPVPS